MTNEQEVIPQQPEIQTEDWSYVPIEKESIEPQSCVVVATDQPN